MATEIYYSSHFSIEIDGFDAVSFTKSTLPSVEFDEISFGSAGSMFDQKTPGRAKYNDITLEFGRMEDGASKAAYEWVTKQIDATESNASSLSEILKDVDLVQYAQNKTEVRRWSLIGAWVKKLEYSDFDGASSEKSIGTLTLAYQYFTES